MVLISFRCGVHRINIGAIPVGRERNFSWRFQEGTRLKDVEQHVLLDAIYSSRSPVQREVGKTEEKCYSKYQSSPIIEVTAFTSKA